MVTPGPLEIATPTSSQGTSVASSAGASAPSAPGSALGRGSLALARYLDVVLVVIAAAPALVLGAPLLGYLLGAGGWIVQRALEQLDKRLIATAAALRNRFGLTLFESFGRIWLLAGAIVIAGVAGSRADGLTAALVIFCAYSIAFALRLISGRPQGEPQR